MLLVSIEGIEAYVAITVAALGLVAVWALFLLWGRLSGQFDDLEEAKYRVLEDGVPNGPGREERR